MKMLEMEGGTIPARSRRRRSGSALVLACVSLAVLALIGGNLFMVLQHKYTAVFQSSAWQEALIAAEAGVDIATSELRMTLMNPDAAFSGARGWVDWEDYADEEGITNLFPQPGSTSGVRFFTTQQKLIRRGEGGTRTWFEVFVDIPPAFGGSADPWYRVRSVGYSELPGPIRLTADRRDSRLRKLSFVNDRHKRDASGNPVPVEMPNGSRVIEVVLKPISAFDNAILGDEYVRLNNHNIYIDSYNSEVADQSTSVTVDGVTYGGQYPGRGWNADLEDTWHADVATNGQMLEAGNATIYGKAKVAADGEVLNPAHVMAGVEDGFYQELLPVQQPQDGADPFTPQTVNASATLVGGATTPTRYQFDEIQLAGNDVLMVARPEGAPAGGEYFVEVVVTGNVSTSGNAMIYLQKGVYLRLFVKGDLSISGNGFLNGSRLPVTLQVYGIEPPLGTERRVDISGNGAFYGSIYAPDHRVRIVGGGNMDTVYGSVVGLSVDMTGVQALHYDEALKKRGLVSDYRVASWVEDTR